MEKKNVLLDVRQAEFNKDENDEISIIFKLVAPQPLDEGEVTHFCTTYNQLGGMIVKQSFYPDFTEADKATMMSAFSLAPVMAQ